MQQPNRKPRKKNTQETTPHTSLPGAHAGTIVMAGGPVAAAVFALATTTLEWRRRAPLTILREAVSACNCVVRFLAAAMILELEIPFDAMPTCTEHRILNGKNAGNNDRCVDVPSYFRI